MRSIGSWGPFFLGHPVSSHYGTTIPKNCLQKVIIGIKAKLSLFLSLIEMLVQLCDYFKAAFRSSANETPTPFDALLAELEAALDALLDTLGPLLGLTDEQIAAIEADIDTLIQDIEHVEHGDIDVDGGLEVIVQDIVNILHDFGVNSSKITDVEATSKFINDLGLCLADLNTLTR